MRIQNSRRASKEHRFDRGSWAMLALASAVLLYSIALALYVALLPTDGWEFQINLTQPNPGYIFTEYYGNGPSPLHPGGPELVPHLLEHWTAFTGPGWEQEDDTTTIILQRMQKKIASS